MGPAPCPHDSQRTRAQDRPLAAGGEGARLFNSTVGLQSATAEIGEKEEGHRGKITRKGR